MRLQDRERLQEMASLNIADSKQIEELKIQDHQKIC